MSIPNSSHVPLPSPKEMVVGTAAFAKVLVKNPKTLTGMVREIVRTRLNTISHTDLNQDQYYLLENGYDPKYIAVLVPGFQLDGTSLLQFKRTFNQQGIPAFFPGKLPYGSEAVGFNQHPDILVERIVRYVQEIQSSYPRTDILLVGHSYGGTQVLHASDHLGSEKGKVIPITVSGVLDKVGPMAQAVHAVKYRIPSQVLSGKDPFIGRAREIQDRASGITIVDNQDGYLPIHVQSGIYADTSDENPNIIISDIKSPGHYRQGVDEYFSRYITNIALQRIKEKEQSMTTPQ